MKAYKTIVLVCLLLGVILLFGLIAGTAFGKIGFDVGILSVTGTAFIDFCLLIAAKSTVEAELKIASASRSKDPRVEIA